MKELRDILEAYKNNRRCDYALATLVRVNGSHYRKAGARLLISESGSVVGSISAGCMETDLCLRSREVIKTGKPALVVYDTTLESDIVWGLNLGCGGEVHVLIECAPGNIENSYLAFLEQCLSNREFAALATVIRVSGFPGIQVGDRFAFSKHMKSYFATSGSRESAQTKNSFAITRALNDDATDIIKRGRSKGVRLTINTGAIEVFFESVRPAHQILICGTGTDVIPLISIANELGWESIIVDSRPRSLTTKNLFNAKQIIRCRPKYLFDHVSLSDPSSAVIATHNYAQDLELLRILLQSNVNYVGLIGSSFRTNSLINDLSESADGFDKNQLQKLFSPAGLDIGSETPEEIALSIIAEAKAVITGSSAGFLRGSANPIHDKWNLATEKS